ncbi:hypothetical protein K7Z75_24710 [Mycobacterium avium subsp. hominissuis]|nr:hypothetical protein [Mycobacterium avium]MDV3306829.1 hypothetical protein [Mycobacterium avium subsp. hominissuis]
MPSITDILWCAVMAASMALVVVFAFWYFRRIDPRRPNKSDRGSGLDLY